MQILRWYQTEDGAKGRNQPEPIPVSKTERDEARLRAAARGLEKPDVLPVDELRRRLAARNGRRHARG